MNCAAVSILKRLCDVKWAFMVFAYCSPLKVFHWRWIIKRVFRVVIDWIQDDWQLALSESERLREMKMNMNIKSMKMWMRCERNTQNENEKIERKKRVMSTFNSSSCDGLLILRQAHYMWMMSRHFVIPIWKYATTLDMLYAYLCVCLWVMLPFMSYFIRYSMENIYGYWTGPW